MDPLSNPLPASAASGAWIDGRTPNPNAETARPGSARAQAARPASRRVTDAPTRMFHWLLAAAFAAAWLTGDAEPWRALHITAGYTIAGLLAFRVVYGLIGPRPVRLSALGRKLSAAPAWLRGLRQRAPGQASAWRQGQNLAMAAVIAALLIGLPMAALSGYVTYAEWGGEATTEVLAEVHEFFANALLAAVAVHVGLIAGLSLLRKQNQALPMLTGRAPAPALTWCPGRAAGWPC